MRVIKTLAILYNADYYARSSSQLVIVVVVGRLKFRLDVLIFARADDRIARHGKGGRSDRSSRRALSGAFIPLRERNVIYGGFNKR